MSCEGVGSDAVVAVTDEPYPPGEVDCGRVR